MPMSTPTDTDAAHRVCRDVARCSIRLGIGADVEGSADSAVAGRAADTMGIMTGVAKGATTRTVMGAGGELGSASASKALCCCEGQASSPAIPAQGPEAPDRCPSHASEREIAHHFEASPARRWSRWSRFGPSQRFDPRLRYVELTYKGGRDILPALMALRGLPGVEVLQTRRQIPGISKL